MRWYIFIFAIFSASNFKQTLNLNSTEFFQILLLKEFKNINEFIWVYFSDFKYLKFTNMRIFPKFCCYFFLFALCFQKNNIKIQKPLLNIYLKHYLLFILLYIELMEDLFRTLGKYFRKWYQNSNLLPINWEQLKIDNSIYFNLSSPWALTSPSEIFIKSSEAPYFIVNPLKIKMTNLCKFIKQFSFLAFIIYCSYFFYVL